MGQSNRVGFDFEEQRLIEEKYSPLIMEFLRVFTEAEPEDVRHQCLEYDFKSKDLTFDLKADRRIGDTNNFFIETESVKGKKKGWLYNNIDYILYLDTKYLILYLLEPAKLRTIEAIIKQWKYQEIPQNADYVTCGHVVPIHVISKHLKFQKILLRYYHDNAFKCSTKKRY